MFEDDADMLIDPYSLPELHQLPPSDGGATGEVRCVCGWPSFERIGTATVSCAIRAVASFTNEVMTFETATAVAEGNFEPIGYRWTLCGAAAHDLAEIAQSRPWRIGARAVLPDGTESLIEASGYDRVVGIHREPTAICGGATYLLRDLRAVDSVHPDQLALAV
jgi:hypothetical protein